MVTLSIVVPFYDVEDYLDETLRSLAAQTHTDFEVVMVDDGSTDNSVDIATDFAARDPRFRLVRQTNHGLGHARNTGTANATGKYLAFADSDDVLPHYAYKLMVDTLERTGSEIAAGNVRRLASRGASGSPMHTEAFATTRLRTQLHRHKSLLRDMTAWNKVYRRRFWDESDLSFPEGVLFEDAPATIPAYVVAQSIDVLEAPVYYWRIREGGAPSITQRGTEWKNISDRIRTAMMVSHFLADHRQKSLKDAFDDMAIKHHFKMILDALPDAEPTVQSDFITTANEYFDTISASVFRDLPKDFRRYCRHIQRRSLQGLLDDLTSGGDTESLARKSLRKLRNVPVKTNVDTVEWRDGRLVVRGEAAPTNPVRQASWNPNVRMLWMRESSTRRFVRLRSSTIKPIGSDDDTNTGGRTGFETVIDPRSLQNNRQWKPGVWSCAIGVVDQLGVHKSGLQVGSGIGRIDLLPNWVEPGVRIIPELRGGNLALRVDLPKVRTDTCRIVDGVLHLAGEVRDRVVRRGRLGFGRTAGNVDYSVPVTLTGKGNGITRFDCRLPVSELIAAVGPASVPPVGGATDRWYMELKYFGTQHESRQLLADPECVGAMTVADGHVLTVHSTPSQYLRMAMRPDRCLATACEWDADGTLHLTGTGTPRPGDRVGMRIRDRRENHSWPVETTADGWRVRLPVNAVDTLAGTVPLRPGTWDLLLHTEDEHDNPIVTNLAIGPDSISAMPAVVQAGGRELSIRRNGIDAAIIHTSDFATAEEAGAVGQTNLRKRHYPTVRKDSPLRAAVVYDSFSGRQYSDSPRAVFNELVARDAQVEHLWVVRDYQFAVPEGATALRYGSRQWYEAMATARYIVANSHLPAWFRRRDGQTVVQTWHGTPLKRIAFDVPDFQIADPSYLDKVSGEVPNWSFLVSPNGFSTERLASAFRYQGEILEIGYPRNDIFFRPDQAELRSTVQRRLGLPTDRKVALYAPTWRDNDFYGMGRYKFATPFDFEAAREALGDEYVIVVRRHPNIVDEIPGAGNGFVFDASTYPDVAELLAVTDVLVTDYSSLMFDFANTGRPMVFFTYDLDYYRDKLRGFYFDFSTDAPGPLVTTSAQTIEALAHIDTVAARYGDAYTRFQERFCHADDGKAGSRLVEQVFDDVIA